MLTQLAQQGSTDPTTPFSRTGSEPDAEIQGAFKAYPSRAGTVNLATTGGREPILFNFYRSNFSDSSKASNY